MFGQQADPTTLMRQASWTVAEYMEQAKKNIDSLFGTGYAKAHPELVAAFITACTKDFDSGIMSQKLEAVAWAVGSLKPEQYGGTY
jgi:NAD(P)H-hydrate repair Nnr-like enzyme with NAD(P)H-hydrate epimerase domain